MKPVKTDLFPKYNDIPEEFKRRNGKWNRLFSDWFYLGLTSLDLTPKEGVSKDDALAHINAMMCSWEVKHEHKEAAFAYLCSQWFADAAWTRKERK